MPVWLLWLLGGVAALRIVGGSSSRAASYNQTISAATPPIDPRFLLPPGSTYRGDPDGTCPFGDEFYLSASLQSAGLPWCIRAGTVKTGIESKTPASVRVFQLTGQGFQQASSLISQGLSTANQLAEGKHQLCNVPIIGKATCSLVAKAKTSTFSFLG